ncbi:MAG: A/G-specific adenine glycosylase [Albidovulum sp.]
MTRPMATAEIGTRLLAWYDRQARIMPWRVGPAERQAGIRPDPYAIWLSEVMLQQTTVAAVTAYFRRFKQRWPTVSDLAGAADADVMAEWAGLGYYARARNLLKCARVVTRDFGGIFPELETDLQALPGIGPYTAAAISAIAHDRPAVVVDGNVERVVARLFAVKVPLPMAKPDLTRLAASLTPAQRPGDHAQAMMDLGATICTPRNPACSLCPLSQCCLAFSQGIAPDLPRRLPKPEKPTRLGIAYVVRRNDGALLLERRPDKGLLGGMLGWPGSEWGTAQPAPKPPLQADWRKIGVEVRHTFTHFHLRLDVMMADVGPDTRPASGGFIAPANFRPADLPTVMRKVYDAAHATLSDG